MIRPNWHEGPDGSIWLVMPPWKDLLKDKIEKEDLTRMMGLLSCAYVYKFLGNIFLMCDFEFVVAKGCISDVVWLAKSKPSFGRLLGVSPEPEPKYTSAESSRIEYVLTEDNSHAMKQVTRNEYKLLVGAELVNRAVNSNLNTSNWKTSAFLPSISIEEKQLIESIGLSASEFWRNCKNGNIEHAKTVVRNTKERRKAKKGTRQYLKDDQCENILTQPELF